MLSSVWDFVKDPDNRAILSWIGGGIAALTAGIWAVVRFRANNSDHRPSKSSVSANRSSVAAGGDLKNSSINIETRGRSKR
jgi:hypothetical protein